MESIAEFSEGAIGGSDRRNQEAILPPGC